MLKREADGSSFGRLICRTRPDVEKTILRRLQCVVSPGSKYAKVMYLPWLSQRCSRVLDIVSMDRAWDNLDDARESVQQCPSNFAASVGATPFLTANYIPLKSECGPHSNIMTFISLYKRA